MISREGSPEVRLQHFGSSQNSPAMFGIDISALKPNQPVSIDEHTPGYPFASLRHLPAGDYYVQALLNVYTQFHRADGHVIWAHDDQWEGQQPNLSPGNLFSKVRRIHWERTSPQTVSLSLSEVIPPIPQPVDTEWVKHVRIQSRLLTAFWGKPMYIGAVVLLPRDYAGNPERRYPVIYQQGHFSVSPPFGFSTTVVPEGDEERDFREKAGIESGYEFAQSWRSQEFPRVIAVTFQHPTPYSDTSFAVNSANQGPYGDAIMTELIPYIEEHFQVIREPYARAVTGASTGGWEALALQLYHPEFFGGAWIFCPDPIDFRRYQMLNIYEDQNAFVASAARLPLWARPAWVPLEVPAVITSDGQIVASVRQQSTIGEVLGSHGRGARTDFAEWNATFNPVGKDGYPQPLWDPVTGGIDYSVAQYRREQGYDLRAYAAEHWAAIGPQLEGKLFFYCADMDNGYLNLAVYLFEDFMRGTTAPHYVAHFEYGRPMKQHGWTPMTNAELVRAIADHLASGHNHQQTNLHEGK